MERALSLLRTTQRRLDETETDLETDYEGLFVCFLLWNTFLSIVVAWYFLLGERADECWCIKNFPPRAALLINCYRFNHHFYLALLHRI
jgi:hypothetical protein